MRSTAVSSAINGIVLEAGSSVRTAVESTKEVFIAPVWQAIKFPLYVTGASLFAIITLITVLKVLCAHRHEKYATLVDQEMAPPPHRTHRAPYNRQRPGLKSHFGVCFPRDKTANKGREQHE